MQHGQRSLLQHGGLGAGTTGGSTQQQPGQFFMLGQVGTGVEPKARGLGAAADLGPDPLRPQVRAQRQDVEARVVEWPIEAQDAALDLEPLAEGAQAGALGAHLAEQAGLIAPGFGLEAHLTTQQAGKTLATHLKLRAQIEVDADSGLKRQALGQRGAGSTAAHLHIRPQARRGFVGQQKQGLVGLQVSAQVEQLVVELGQQLAAQA
ncbi:MAG: hypothetical protein JM57_11620 [Comamonadaceae bacterium BICA1-1]|nr:MAG: hypothetical protein JM57_11620 [Comamonadaceae bacterium BICA1-1]